MLVPILTQDFGENENENHADEETGLLSSSTDTSVTNDADGKPGGQTGQTDGQTSTKLDEVGKQRGPLRQAVGDQDGNDETVDTDDTSHDDGDNVWGLVSWWPYPKPLRLAMEGGCFWDHFGPWGGHTLDDQVGPENTHGRDTNTGLGGTVGGAEAGEDDGGRAAHRTEEGLCRQSQHLVLVLILMCDRLGGRRAETQGALVAVRSLGRCDGSQHQGGTYGVNGATRQTS